ncbi:MAG TPA: Kazal-type serine protease inhibitor [Myxococcota bacterium]|nr:Kazal-type serine protease inhibitor [Myxococcota bacterium]
MKSIALTLLLAACDASQPDPSLDHAEGLAADEAPPPPFDLYVASRLPGQRAPGSVANLPPRTDVYIVVSRDLAAGAGACPPNPGAACSDLAAPATFMVHVQTNAYGWASFDLRVPQRPLVEPGDTLYAQAMAIGAGGQVVWSAPVAFDVDLPLCPDIDAPVCGYGNVEMSNACYLNQTYGLLVKHRGRC